MQPGLVAYRGTAPALNDLIGGHVDFFCEQAVSVAPQIIGGAIKAYGVSATERLAILPDVPTAKEAGIDYQMSIWAGIFAPKGTPKEIVDKLATALDQTLDDPGVQQASVRSWRIASGQGRTHAGQVRRLREGGNRPLVPYFESSQCRGEVMMRGSAPMPAATPRSASACVSSVDWRYPNLVEIAHNPRVCMTPGRDTAPGFLSPGGPGFLFFSCY